jgi:hypothetical protein
MLQLNEFNHVLWNADEVNLLNENINITKE